jgi:hypothetical protein
MKTIFADGLDCLREHLNLAEIARLIEQTARWVSPETFEYLPLWYPEHARGKPFYKSSWSSPQTNTTRATGVSAHKTEGNSGANNALTSALGTDRSSRKNWSCCHIWGIDDYSYQTTNTVVSDHRFFSCVGNMVLLLTPLKAFTDSMPEIKTMLRICARNLYDWQCDHEDMALTNKALDEWSD